MNNSNKIDPRIYLDAKGIQFKERNGELITKCPINLCDLETKHAGHCYFSMDTGQYFCHKCGESGNLITLAKHFGDNLLDYYIESSKAVEKPRKIAKKIKLISDKEVNSLQKNLPNRIRHWLTEVKGIDEYIISYRKLGFGEYYGFYWITIPIRTDEGWILRLRRDPDDETNDCKNKNYPFGTSIQLYGKENLENKLDSIVVCEGEMDMLLLESMGIDAVTSTGGAGSFRSEWADYFSNLREVIVCYDNDDQGRKGADKVTALFSLRLPDTSVSRIDLPDKVGEKGDVSDYFIKHIGNADDFMALKQSCSNTTRCIPLEKGGVLNPITISELMEKEFEATEWHVEKLIPSSAIIAISAPPANFKTWLALDIALSIAGGKSVFGEFATSQANVLIIDEENNPRLIQKRLRMLGCEKSLPIRISSLANFKVSKPNVNEILKYAKKHDIGIVFFDSLVRIHGADENDAGKMSRVFEDLKAFTKEGISVVFTHHNRKSGANKIDHSQSMRGSSDILAAIDCHLSISQKDDVITINQTKLRQEEELKPFTIKIIKEDSSLRFVFDGEATDSTGKKDNAKIHIREILETAVVPPCKSDIYKQLRDRDVDGGKSTFKTALKEMAENEEIFTKKGQKNSSLVSLSSFDVPEKLFNS
jgi:hypothetical protein